MRLACVLRKTLPFATPARAGIPPTWDRPDPPASARTPRSRRLTTNEKHSYFFDASSPTFMLVNSEVAEGDLLQALPNFLKRISYFFAVGIIVGALGVLWTKKSNILLVSNFEGEASRLEDEKKNYETKYGLKDLLNNPWKLNVWPESFPIRNGAIQEKSAIYEQKQRSIDLIRQINQEGLTYWKNLYAQSQESLKKGGAHH